jgi:hypothetical protein
MSMAVGIKVGSITDEIGTGDFFHAFFSTVSGNLEPSGWGSKFPTVMNKLYKGKVNPKEAVSALDELKEIQSFLSSYKTEKVIWDIEAPEKQPPWGTNISSEITSLDNYFVTSTGRDLINTLLEALEDAVKSNKPLEIVQY